MGIQPGNGAAFFSRRDFFHTACKIVEKPKRPWTSRRNTGGTSCGAQGHDMEPAPAGTAAGLGHPIFFGGGADRHPDAGGLRALCPGVRGGLWARGRRDRRPAGRWREGGAVSGLFRCAALFGRCDFDLYHRGGFQGLKLLEGPLFHPLAGAGLFLAVSGIYVLQSLSPLRNLAPCLAATALVASPHGIISPAAGRRGAAGAR